MKTPRSVILFCLLATCTWTRAQVFDPYLAAVAGDADLLKANIGGTPDKYGMNGSNSHLSGNSSGSGPFVADEQRGSIDTMLAGLALQEQWHNGQQLVVPQALCDLYVQRGIAAIQGAYNVQAPNGSMPDHVDENVGGSGTVTGTGDKGPGNMLFFLAYSNQALYLMTKNNYYMTNPVFNGGTQTGAQVLAALYPKIKLAMDYFTSPDGVTPAHAWMGTHNLFADHGTVPNRVMIIICAYGYGAALLENTSYNANFASYRTEGQWWVANEFKSCAAFTAHPRPLFDKTTGVFIEGGITNRDSGFGYDTNYQAVGCRFLNAYTALYPHDIADALVTTPVVGNLKDVETIVRLANHWLARRIMTVDPRSGAPGNFIDETIGTRTGPTGGFAEDKVTGFDSTAARFALLMYDNLLNQLHPMNPQTEGEDTARYLEGGLLANPVCPPTIVNFPTLVLQKNVAMGTYPNAGYSVGILNSSSYNIMATNSAQLSTSTTYQDWDTGFAIGQTGLPSGLVLSGASSPNPFYGSQTPDGSVNPSMGLASLTGAPTTAGTSNVVLTAQNTITSYTFSEAPKAVTPPTRSTAGIQTGLPFTLAVMVTNLNSLSAVADAYTNDGSSAGLNYGTSSTLKVKTWNTPGSGFSRKAYIKFDTSGVPGTIVRAVLHLWGDYGTSTQNYCDVQCFGVSAASWTEGSQNGAVDGSGGVCWNNQPAQPSAGNLLDTFSVPKAVFQWNDWDVTEWVKDHPGSVSFELRGSDQTDGACTFNSRESVSNKPALLVYYQ